MHLLLPDIKTKLVYHLLGWSIFIVYEVSFITIIRWASADIPFWNGYFLPYSVNIALFYCHALFILPHSFRRQQYKWVALIVLVAIEILFYLVLIALKDVPQEQTASPFFLGLYMSKISFIQQLWRGIYFLIFSTAYWLIQQSFLKKQQLKEAETRELLQQQENQKLELALVSTQNAYLQSQINPHLLFNTLNFIHSEVQQVSPTASEAIITLSDMMRYSLATEKANGKAPLEDEIEQIENLIRINQFRFNQALSITFQCSGNVKGVAIIPLLLVPFVENLFKYGELDDSNNPAVIILHCEGETLFFSTTNKKRKTIPFRSSGIGIKNVKTRLNTHYPDNFSLRINDAQTTFLLELTIKL